MHIHCYYYETLYGYVFACKYGTDTGKSSTCTLSIHCAGLECYGPSLDLYPWESIFQHRGLDPHLL